MIQVIEQPDAALLEELATFLAAAGPDAGVCAEHDPRWLAVLDRALDHRTFALIARQGDAPPAPIAGYLPLALVASRLFGRFLVSLPYLNQAGAVAADAAVRGELINEAVELARVHDVQYLELRHGRGDEHQGLSQSREDKVRMVLDLPPDANDLWQQINSKVRNQVRKGDKLELALRFGGGELAADFYAVFAENMRDLGTPVYTRRLFDEILTRLGDDAELAVVAYQGQPVAGALLIHNRRFGLRLTQVPSASCLRRFNHINANMWMYHRLLQRAIERGSAAFDLGVAIFPGESVVQAGSHHRPAFSGGSQSDSARRYCHTRPPAADS